MDDAREAREMTCQEWAESIVSAGSQPLDAALLAAYLTAAEARGARREREACCNLANEHANTIDERRVAETPYGRHMTEQQCIDVASSQRHVAQYVGVLISKRNPQPPPGFGLKQ